MQFNNYNCCCVWYFHKFPQALFIQKPNTNNYIKDDNFEIITRKLVNGKF